MVSGINVLTDDESRNMSTWSFAVLLSAVGRWLSYLSQQVFKLANRLLDANNQQLRLKLIRLDEKEAAWKEAVNKGEQ